MRRFWPRAASTGRPRAKQSRAAAAYEQLLARRPEAYADHAATFFIGLGNRPERAVDLAVANWKLRDTPRARSLLSRAQRNAVARARESIGGSHDAFAFAGLVAGFVHVLSGPDHLAAIAPYAVDSRSRAWRTGVRWGLGHTAGVLCVGAAAAVAA